MTSGPTPSPASTQIFAFTETWLSRFVPGAIYLSHDSLQVSGGDAHPAPDRCGRNLHATRRAESHVLPAARLIGRAVTVHRHVSRNGVCGPHYPGALHADRGLHLFG